MSINDAQHQDFCGFYLLHWIRKSYGMLLGMWQSRLMAILPFFDAPNCTKRRGIARLSHCVCENLGLKARFTSFRVQPSSARLVEPSGVRSLPEPTNNKGCHWHPSVVWWSRGESNPRPQALHRQFYILSQAI